MRTVIVIAYTTLYRKGGSQFTRVANTMANEMEQMGVDCISQPVESKQDLKDLFAKLKENRLEIREFHFIGHGGMYGPMFGTVAYPEQFSPHELRTLQIPFGKEASAFFHCCRSARWFAPYFARAQQVETFGFHWYTTFSSRKDKYKFPSGNSETLYCFGCPGRKSHGIFASFRKFLGVQKPELLKSFKPGDHIEDRTYNQVAALYAETFRDIKVRRDEFAWIMKHLPVNKGIRVLDIGCGNGALLRELNAGIAYGVGVDISENLLLHARKQSKEFQNLEFLRIDKPELPFEKDSFDLVVSLLSFRYLDWDPLMLEIERVLKNEGKLLIVDMVNAPLTIKEWPIFFWSKMSHYLDRQRFAEFYMSLRKLVSHPDWQQMLKYNPIRSQHEMVWYLESRFPGRKVEVINVGLHSRILAFDSESMKEIKHVQLTYP